MTEKTVCILDAGPDTIAAVVQSRGQSGRRIADEARELAHADTDDARALERARAPAHRRRASPQGLRGARRVVGCPQPGHAGAAARADARGFAVMPRVVLRRRRVRARLVRCLWRFCGARLTARTLARRLVGRVASDLVAELLDGLLRCGDRIAAELAAGPLADRLDAVTLNPTSHWRSATGRLRGIARGSAGLRARVGELADEARRAGYRPGAEPLPWTLEGSIVDALAALLDLRVVARRARRGEPLLGLRGCSRPSSVWGPR